MSTFTYDALGRLTGIGHASDGTPVMTLGYTYDAVGNVTSRTDDRPTVEPVFGSMAPRTS